MAEAMEDVVQEQGGVVDSINCSSIRAMRHDDDHAASCTLVDWRGGKSGTKVQCIYPNKAKIGH